MGPNLIALAVPLFFLGIALEVWVARRRRLAVYRLADALSDIGCGVLQQVSQLLYGAALLAVYAWVHGRFALVRFPEGSVWPWVIAVVGVEFAYYWWHRLSHEVNFLWAAHVVHHQSEDYNLAVALRQSALTSLTVFPFYVTLAFAGVPALHFGVVVGLSTLYQFWIHTQLIGKLGWFERWFNTPALHRVHHAINPRYIDKNYGAAVMIFDRLFGTWEPETERPVYGLVSPLRSFNPLWAQLAYPVSLVRRTLRARSLRDALHLWLKGPEYHLPGVEAPHPPMPVEPSSYAKFDVAPPPGVTVHVVTQFVLLVALAFAVMLWGGGLPLAPLAALTVFTGASLAIFAGLLEARPWAVPAERIRLALAVGALAAAMAIRFDTQASSWAVALAGFVTLSVATGAWRLLRSRAASGA